MKELKIETKRGTLLDGVLFEAEHEADTVKSSGIAASRGSDTVLICITGIHGNFTDGDPSGFLCNINAHMPTASENRLLFIERTGHTYQQKQQEQADKILLTIIDWKGKRYENAI